MKVECAGARGAAERGEARRERFGAEMARAEGRARAKRPAGEVGAAGAEVRGGVGFAGEVAIGGGAGDRSRAASPGGEGEGARSSAAARDAVSVRAGRDAGRQCVEIDAGDRLACALEQGPRGVEIQVCAAPVLLAAARTELQAVTAELQRRGVRVARAELRARERSGDWARPPGGSRRAAR